MTITRRRPVAGAAMAAAAATVLAACGGAATSQGGDDGEVGELEPIRIAIVSPHSGPYAQFGEDQRAGYQFAVDEANANGGIDGREVELFVADSQGTNEGAVAAAQRLVQQEDAQFILGMVATPVSLAIMQRLESWDALAFGVQSQGDDLTGSACEPRFFRTNMTDHQDIQGLVTWLEDQEITDWDVISADYAFGIDGAEGLHAEAEQEGWTVDVDVRAPLGTTDYASHINQLNGGQGLLINLSGGDSVNFLSQALDFGLFDDYEYVIGNTALTNSSLEAVDSEELVGLYGTANWGRTADNENAQAFVEAFTEANGEPPRDFTGAAYMGLQTLFAGVEAAGSVDPTEVAQALEGLTFESIKGDVTMRAEDHQMAAPMYIGQVELSDDGYDLVVVDEMPMDVTMPDPDPSCEMGEL
jgi:branched-chain amino acid transport system substrate-binding protein